MLNKNFKLLYGSSEKSCATETFFNFDGIKRDVNRKHFNLYFAEISINMKI